MATPLDKRRRNARPSKYRPRTPEQKQRRLALWAARADERKARKAIDTEASLRERLAELEIALQDQGHSGVHGKRHTRPLEEIEDEAQRLGVLKARVERLESLWTIDRRKRETRGKIIIGGALLAELIDAISAGDRALFSTVLDVLDHRVDGVRDRLTVKELLGDAPLPLHPGGDGLSPLDGFGIGAFSDAPDFDALVQTAMAHETLVRPGEVDGDYADLEGSWRAPS